MPTGVIPMEKSQYLAFFGSLHLIGVNMLVFEDEGGVTRMPLDEIARLDPKVAEKKEVPMLNTALQLTVIYFIQELRRPNQKKDDMVRMKRLQELEEEMIADLVRSRFILAVDFSKVEGEIEPGKTNPNVQVPVVKAPNGDAFQPMLYGCMGVPEIPQESRSEAAYGSDRVQGIVRRAGSTGKGDLC